MKNCDPSLPNPEYWACREEKRRLFHRRRKVAKAIGIVAGFIVVAHLALIFLTDYYPRASETRCDTRDVIQFSGALPWIWLASMAYITGWCIWLNMRSEP